MLRVLACFIVLGQLLWPQQVTAQNQQSSVGFTLPTVAQLNRFPAEVQALAASEDGQFFAIGWNESDNSPGGVSVFHHNLTPASPPLSLDGGNCSDVKFTSDGRYLLALSAKTGLHCWDRQRWQRVAAHEDSLWDWQIVLLPNPQECLTLGGRSEIQHWSLPEIKLLQQFPTPFKRIVSAAITSDGRRLVMVGRTGNRFQIQVRSFPKFKLQVEFPLADETWFLSQVALFPDNRRFAIGQSDGTIWVGHLDNEKPLQKFSSPMARTHQIQFIDDRRALLHGWARPLGVMDLETGAFSRSDVATNGGKGMAVIETPRRLLLAHGSDDRDKGVTVYQFASNRPLLAALQADLFDAPSNQPPMPVAGTTPTPTTTLPGRQPVPDEQKLAAAKQELETLMGGGDDAQSSNSWPSRLLKLASEEGDPVMVFAMLDQAAEQAVEAFDTSTADAALRRLGQQFDVDTLQLAGKLLYAVRNRPIATDERRQMADWAERLGDSALATEEIAYASAFYNIAINWSAREREDLRRRRDKGEKTDAFLSEFRQAEPARRHLKDDPNHPQANQVWGSYLCFVRGKWQDGLPMLALAEEDDLRKLAQSDLAVADEPEAMLALADQWANYALQQQQDQVRHAAVTAAKFWYEKAIGRLKGADRLRAEATASELIVPDGFPQREWPRQP